MKAKEKTYTRQEVIDFAMKVSRNLSAMYSIKERKAWIEKHLTDKIETWEVNQEQTNTTL